MLDFLSSDKESDDDTVSDPIAYDPNESFTSKEMTSDIDYGKDRAAWLAKMKADLQETSGLDKSKRDRRFFVNTQIAGKKQDGNKIHTNMSEKQMLMDFHFELNMLLL